MITGFQAGVMGTYGWSPSALFSAGEQGIWLDPSDFSTMFQDSAGTTPVTAADQYVGKILDKSGRGNHATQSDNAKRPQLKLADGKYYLQFDGSDDLLATANIDLSATDKLTILAGAMKAVELSTVGFICEFSQNLGSYNGTFALAQSGSNSIDRKSWSFYTKGTVVEVYRQARTYAAPITNVLSGKFYNAAATLADQIVLRVNAASPPTIYNGPGLTAAGNYGNLPLYIGARANGTLLLNGRIYSLIIRGASTADSTLANAERWVADKTGITL